MKKVFLPVAVIKTPYTRQGDLTDSFVNRAGGAPASFARLIKINGEQVQGCARGWTVSFRGGQRVALTVRGRAPRKIIKIIWPRRGQSIGVENLRNKQSRGNCGKNRLPRMDDSGEAGTSSVEPSSIPDGGKRRKINDSARRESTVEIIILTLRKEDRTPRASLKFRDFGNQKCLLPVFLFTLFLHSY